MKPEYAGLLWFDTSTDSMKTLSGGEWVEIGDAVTHRWTLEMMRECDE